jgi:hypothetical protein
VVDSANTAKRKQRAEKGIILGILIFFLLGMIAVKFKPDLSKATFLIDIVDSDLTEVSPVSPRIEAQINTVDSDLTEAPPRIEAIIFSSSGSPSAYVGGEYVREGDIVNGFTILRIYPNTIEFEKHGKTVTGVFPPTRE